MRRAKAMILKTWGPPAILLEEKTD